MKIVLTTYEGVYITDAPAFYTCEDCKDAKLCKPCFDAHKRTCITRNHTILPIALDLKTKSIVIDHDIMIVEKKVKYLNIDEDLEGSLSTPIQSKINLSSRSSPYMFMATPEPTSTKFSFKSADIFNEFL